MAKVAKKTKTNQKAKAAPQLTQNVDAEDWLTMYQQMVRIRAFEERVNGLYTAAKMPGLAHLYIGEEAIAVGVCSALNKEDYITSTHRGHGHCIAKGADVDIMFAELLGKAAGYCKGKGGSMHIADQKNGNLGANAIVGGSAGIAVGAAFSAKRLGTGQVAVCFFGEGALGQGLIYETMNLAQLWKLPVIFVCENNQYNEYTHFTETSAGQVADRGKSFGIHTEEIDGQDIRLVFETATRLVARARKGEGPAFLMCHTYRYHGHHVGDIDRAYYRSKAEEKEWIENRDPITIFGDWLLKQKLSDQAVLDSIRTEVKDEVERGAQFALDAPYPDPSEVDTNVYA
jgi:TPP-dependent pyruvate/acetoin dehydrogenase alpha subunit